MNTNRVIYTFWLPMVSEDFTSGSSADDKSIIRRIRNKLRFYLDIRRNVFECSHISNSKRSREEQEKDAGDKLISYQYADDADSTFSYDQFRFVFNSKKITFTVDEFGFYFIEFECSTYDDKDDKRIVLDLIDALFIDTHNEKDNLNILSSKQEELLSSSLLNFDLLYEDFITNKEKNTEKIKQKKLKDFLHSIVKKVELSHEDFKSYKFNKYKEEVNHYPDMLEKRLYDLDYTKSFSSSTIEQSFIQDKIEEKAISNFLDVATSYSYLERIQDSVQHVSSSLINKIYFLSTNENMSKVSYANSVNSWQDEDVEQYIELANYSTASFKTIDRLISYAYFIKIGNKTSYNSIGSDEEIGKLASYNKWKMTIDDFGTKVKNSLELLQSHNEKKSYNELEEINRHHLSEDDNDSIKQLINKNNDEKVGLSDSAMERLQYYVSIFTALAVAIPISAEISNEYESIPKFLGMDIPELLLFFIFIPISYFVLYSILNFLITRNINERDKSESISFPFIKLEYKSRHKLENFTIKHIHHFDFNHEVFNLLKSMKIDTIKNIMNETASLLDILKIDDIGESMQIEHAIIYRRKRIYEQLKENFKVVKLDLESDERYKLKQDIEVFNENEINTNRLDSYIKKFQNSEKYRPLLVEKFTYNNIPQEILDNEYSHRIERINRYKHKILFRYTCSDIEDKKEFTNYILDENTRKIITDDIENNSNYTKKEKKELINIIKDIGIKCLITYSFEIKSVAKKEAILNSNLLLNRLEHFNVYKDYIKIYFSINIPNGKKRDFIRVRDIINYNISNTFYEKIIHHMHSDEDSF